MYFALENGYSLILLDEQTVSETKCPASIDDRSTTVFITSGKSCRNLLSATRSARPLTRCTK
jgi:hypothetical protein